MKNAERVQSHDKSNTTKFENDTKEVIKLDEDVYMYIKEQVHQAISDLEMLQGKWDQTSNETNQANEASMVDVCNSDSVNVATIDRKAHGYNEMEIPEINSVLSIDRKHN